MLAALPRTGMNDTVEKLVALLPEARCGVGKIFGASGRPTAPFMGRRDVARGFIPWRGWANGNSFDERAVLNQSEASAYMTPLQNAREFRSSLKPENAQ